MPSQHLVLHSWYIRVRNSNMATLFFRYSIMRFAHIYIYIYIERERERETHTNVCSIILIKWIATLCGFNFANVLWNNKTSTEVTIVSSEYKNPPHLDVVDRNLQRVWNRFIPHEPQVSVYRNHGSELFVSFTNTAHLKYKYRDTSVWQVVSPSSSN